MVDLVNDDIRTWGRNRASSPVKRTKPYGTGLDAASFYACIKNSISKANTARLASWWDSFFAHRVSKSARPPPFRSAPKNPALCRLFRPPDGRHRASSPVKRTKPYRAYGPVRLGAGGGTRTHTVLLPTDFESVTSANSITPALTF